MSLKKQPVYLFDRFRLHLQERLLERDSVPVSIGPKVLDALVLLVENAGTLVDRNMFRERLWAGQIIEDGTLARVIADLRKALGDGADERRFIETVPKFGYRFVAPVTTEASEPATELVLPEAVPDIAIVAPPKNRKLFIGIAAGLLCAVAAAGFVVEHERNTPHVQSLLITPFPLIGEGPDAAMLPLGLQDSLTMELSGLSNLAVIELKPQGGLSDDLAELGRQHRTDFVLAGSIQLASGKIHLSARMLRSATGEALWTRTFEENQEDILKAESRLAKLTAGELLPALPANEQERMARRLPANAAAYRYYLLGRHYWNKRDQASYPPAIENFKKAAEADPNYAPAYVGLADSYLLDAGFRLNPFQEALPLAKAAVEKAIAIDPTLGGAHATLAQIAGSYYFDWDKEEQELKTAIRLAPNYVTAHHWYAEFLSMMGKFDQSEAEFEIARNLDPASAIVLTDLAQLYNFEKNYRRSFDTLDDVLKLDASFHLAHDRKGYALMMMHKPQEALREFEIGEREAGRPIGIGQRAWLAAAEGKREEAIRLARQSEQQQHSPLLQAMIFSELGDVDTAIDWLQKAYDARSAGLISVKVNGVFDRLHSSPRFQELLRKMNLG